jgi:tripartite-type tricarboxylate transporter receptor subunit TctC
VLEPIGKSGKVRALALFATERTTLLPDLPTSAELGYLRMLMSNWYGMLALASTPADVRNKLKTAMLEAIKSPLVAQRLAAGGVMGATGANGFRARLERDSAYWPPELKKLGISEE